MLVKYVTLGGSTLAQVCNDLALLASGSPISALSASCDKNNSAVIANTTDPGWSLVDSNGPSSSSVISCRDAGDTYTKRCAFESTSGVIYLRSYDGYNTSTHTGTNGCTAISIINFAPAFTAGVVKTFYLYVTPRTVILCDGSTGTRWSGCLEFTKDASYFQNGAIYPCHGSFDGSCAGNNGYSTGKIPRMKNPTAIGDNLAGASLNVGLGTINVGGSIQYSVPIRDTVDALSYPLNPMFAVAHPINSLANSTILGKFYDILNTTTAAGNAFDTINDGVDSYMIALGYGNFTIAIKME